MSKKIDRVLIRVEQVLLFLCLGVFAFVIIDVYVFDAIRGPWARKEYYELGDIPKEPAQNEMNQEEGTRKATISKEGVPESDNQGGAEETPPGESSVEQE
jgi:hypothetical protein